MTDEQFYFPIFAAFIISCPLFAFIHWRWAESYITAVIIVLIWVAIFIFAWVFYDFWDAFFVSIYAICAMALSSKIASWVEKQP